MDYIKAIDESICELDLESRIAEARQQDEDNRKQLSEESRQILNKLKESASNESPDHVNINSSDGNNKSEPCNIWSKASEYIDYAQSLNPKINENCSRMVNVIKKKANAEETKSNRNNN